MSPMVSDRAFLAKFVDISTTDVWQDLRDTQNELKSLRKARASTSGLTDRMSHMRRRKCSADIKEHEDLIEKLRRLLKLRGEDIR